MTGGHQTRCACCACCACITARHSFELNCVDEMTINHGINPASPYNHSQNLYTQPPTLPFAPVSPESSHFVEYLKGPPPSQLHSNQEVGTQFRMPHRNVQSVFQVRVSFVRHHRTRHFTCADPHQPHPPCGEDSTLVVPLLHKD